MPVLHWEQLLNSRRRKHDAQDAAGVQVQRIKTVEHRTELERDHDRILFSTPVRRMQDKTQVFPLDPHDSVRTRLTHSHEVANMARSIGTAITHVYQEQVPFPPSEDAQRNVPALLLSRPLRAMPSMRSSAAWRSTNCSRLPTSTGIDPR